MTALVDPPTFSVAAWDSVVEPDVHPEGWGACSLRDLVDPSKARVEPSQVPDVPYLSLEHVESESGRIIGHGRGSDVTSTKSRFAPGDVLYGKLRPYLNKVALPGFEGICSTDILVFSPPTGLDATFLRLALAQRPFVDFAAQRMRGNSLPRVNFEDLSAFPFPLPPLAEQRRIVERVDELLAAVDATREYLARASELLTHLRQSILQAAFAGQLTADFRADEKDGAAIREEVELPPVPPS